MEIKAMVKWTCERINEHVEKGETQEAFEHVEDLEIILSGEGGIEPLGCGCEYPEGFWPGD